MEDLGKHRFHDLEHDSKTRLFTTYSHLYPARLRSLRENATTTENLKRRTGDGKKGYRTLQVLGALQGVITPFATENAFSGTNILQVV